MDTIYPCDNEIEIPDFISTEDKFKCENCQYICRPLYSRYDCKKFLLIISVIKIIFSIMSFSAYTVFSLIHYSGFWKVLLGLIFLFIFLLTLDLLSDKFLKYICIKAEKRRRKKYDDKVKKLREEQASKTIDKTGLTDNVQKFINHAKSLLDDFKDTFDAIKDGLNNESKDEKRVITKFQATINELEILNSKLSENTFESTYISTLYEIHLPTLLAYCKQFLDNLNLKTLTLKQIVEFAKLLEVFRIKISKHTEYIQNKIEDDFIIKMQALNNDVMPEYDGREVQDDE